jgi:glutamate 5-kinase
LLEKFWFAPSSRGEASSGYSVMSLFPPSSCPRLIVKIGSALLVDPEGGVRRAGWRALPPISPSVPCRTADRGGLVGRDRARRAAAGLAKGGRASLEDAQAAAAVGQIALSQVWAETLGANGLTAAQMLVTLDDLEDRRRYLNAAATLDRLLGLGVVPVLNENDSVATEEIRFGDNDRLAARVAQAAGAQGVVLLSDVDGLYDRNPALPGAEHIARVERIDGAIEAMADKRLGLGHGFGRHGLEDRRRADRQCRRRASRHRLGPDRASALGRGAAHLVRRREDGAGAQGLAGGRADRARHDPCRCRRGPGARGGKSLLAAGATRVEGDFVRGDLVVIAGPEGASSRAASPNIRATMPPASPAAQRRAGRDPRLCAALDAGASQPYGAAVSTIAITGGTGFVGSRLIALAVEAGHQVRALTRRDQAERARSRGSAAI